MKQRLEQNLQREIIVWFNANYSPNDGVLIPVVNEAARLNVNQLVLKGVSDLIAVLPKKVVFVELKQPQGYQSKHQQIFQKRVEGMNYEYHIIRSLDEFKNIL